MKKFENNPIENIEWCTADRLSANSYNPNYVYMPELKLIEFSLKKQGWIQPILVTQDYEIIDGFHRWTIAKNNHWMVPVVKLNLTEPERKLLTVRINRAKGSHIAFKMSDLIKSLVHEHGLPIKQIAEEIGATKDEIELLLMDDVFKKLKIAEHEYSKAWYPKK
jgi:ParB-like chromosome segregation protein Spo0J